MLNRPVRLSDERWDSIELHLARLISAEGLRDAGLVVGLAKDLVETVAKVVCAQMSVAGPAESEVRSWLRTEQDAVVGRVGTGDAGEARKLLGIMAKGAIALVDMRNQMGSGHGHVTVPTLHVEDALVAADFAKTWSQWILRMIDRALEHRVGDLVDRLGGGRSFYEGDLAGALRDLDLERLSTTDQRRIGVAVGRRSIGGTGTVIREGVQPLRSQQSAFPHAYQLGLAEGLLLDEEGRLTDFRGFEGDIGAALTHAGGHEANEVLRALNVATWTQRLSTNEAMRSDLAWRLRLTTATLPVDLQEPWVTLANRLQSGAQPDFYDGPDDDNWGTIVNG